MVNIAVIEDNTQDRKLIVSYIKRYGDENSRSYKVSEFENGVTFLTNYKPVYDAVFIDIQMPYINGMQLAEKLREVDTAVTIVFITNMSNFAINGYSVNAADFVVKPVAYYSFSAMMSKISRIAERLAKEIMIKTPDGGVRLKTDEILFVEIADHKVVYHTDKENIEIWGTLTEQENKLSGCGFARCNNYCIVNLKYVDKITAGYLTIGDNTISITRTRKREFMKQLVAFYGSGF